MKTFLQLRGIDKAFGRVRALCGIDLDLGDDELLVVLGPTGAGKTTLLRIMAGLERADGGSVHMAGEDVGAWEPAQRDVAFAFQNVALYPDWSVRRNLEFPLRAPGRLLAEDEIGRRVNWVAELLHIERLLDRPSVQLSGGEMQRVAIGRCIVRRPRLFLLDEPLTNLDAKLREALRVELTLLRRELGIPMVYVTHDQAEALSMADRIVVLSEGRVLQIGTPEAIYRQPNSPQVARQLGQPAINLFQARSQGGKWVVGGEGALAPTTVGDGVERTLGVRPEDINPDGGQGEARVRVVEDAGPTWILLVDWLGTSVHIIADKTRRYGPGQRIWPQVAAERVVIWDVRAESAV